ncbi:MAG: PAS domain S-box protein [Actinobacteria bacterium]|nr:MAG: PAS domain S-box protein [Actinomycetota bacterium]
MPERWLEAARQGEVQRAIIENAPLATILHDEETVLYANPAALALVGARRLDELVGRNLFDFVHPDGEASARERVQLVYERDLSVHRVACKISALDGTGVDCVVTGYPVHVLGRNLIIAVVMPLRK